MFCYQFSVISSTNRSIFDGMDTEKATIELEECPSEDLLPKYERLATQYDKVSVHKVSNTDSINLFFYCFASLFLGTLKP